MAKSDVTADDQEELTEKLSSVQIRARAKLEKMIRERGLKPMSVERLHAMGDLWPEEDSVDEFLAAVREWRKGDHNRRLP